MTAKEAVKSIYPKAKAEKHSKGRIISETYWLIRNGNNTMYMASGDTQRHAWENAEELLRKKGFIK